MYASFSEFDVLKKSIHQTFDGCRENSNASVYVKQRDTGFLFLITLSKKYAEVRCDLTGKVIKKRKWNNETKNAATQLLAEHKIPKTGWYIFWFIMFSIIGVSFYGIYTSIASGSSYDESFVSKTDDEKNKLLLQLDKGDYIKTATFTYKISAIDKTNITLVKSNNAVTNAYDPIDEGQKFDVTPIKIDPATFYEQQTILTDNRRELIMQILDK